METRIILTQYDLLLITSTLKSKGLISGWLTLDKHQNVKGLYEFQPKGKSYYINLNNQTVQYTGIPIKFKSI
jgi:hypothetical protein